MEILIRPIGNSRGIVLPKAVLIQAGLHDTNKAELAIVDNAIILRRPRTSPRTGWAQAATTVARLDTSMRSVVKRANIAESATAW
jgi:antitoxin MazE